MKFAFAFVASFCAALISVGSAQSRSNCVYNSTLCTCFFGTTDGDCWDPLAGKPGFCERRVCDAGWTCDCDGDYYCHRGPTTVSIVDPSEVDNNPAACTTMNDEIRINMAGCKLGYFHPIISPTGFNAGRCQNWVWWLNGGNPQNAFSNGGGSAAATLDALTQWNDLPLKPGDVIAHRFRNEWEECFAGAKLSVNGTASDTRNTIKFRTTHSNNFVANWYDPGFDDSQWATNGPVSFGTDVWNDDTATGKVRQTSFVLRGVLPKQ